MNHRVPAAIAAVFLASATQAQAHAFLKTAEPAVGSVLTAAPAEVAIAFTEEVEPKFSTITVKDAKGARVDTGGAHPGADAAHLVVAVKPLAPGVYSVAWRATAADDAHKTQGRFSFTVKP